MVVLDVQLDAKIMRAPMWFGAARCLRDFRVMLALM